MDLKNLIPLHPLTSIEIQKYYQNKPRFNGVYSRDKKIKDGVYVINFDECADVGTHWTALYALNNDVVEHKKQTYLGYKHMNPSCVDIVALDLLILCLQLKL